MEDPPPSPTPSGKKRHPRSPLPGWSSLSIAKKMRKTFDRDKDGSSSREQSPTPSRGRSASPGRGGGGGNLSPGGPSSQPPSPRLARFGRMASIGKLVSKSDANLFQSIKSRLSKRFERGRTEDCPEGGCSSASLHSHPVSRTGTPTPARSAQSSTRSSSRTGELPRRTFSSCCRREISLDTMDGEMPFGPSSLPSIAIKSPSKGGGPAGVGSNSKPGANPKTTGDEASLHTTTGESRSTQIQDSTNGSKGQAAAAAGQGGGVANANTNATPEMGLGNQSQFHTLMVHLQHGRRLVARDACGSSDPYVKVKIGDKMLHKSKTINRDLNPTWDETFILPIVDINQHVVFKVFDYDWGLSDDFMGMTSLDPSRLPLNKQTELSLILTETNTPGTEYMGEIVLSLTLVPRTLEEKEIWMSGDGRFVTDTSKRAKSQIWSSVLTILLIEARNLTPGPDAYVMDSYVKFRLGTQKYKTRTVARSTSPKWLEQFDFYLYEGQPQILDVQVYDEAFSKDYIGRVALDIGLLDKERTVLRELKLQEGSGEIQLLLTVSGTHGVDSPSDLINYVPPLPEVERQLRSNYSLTNSLNSIGDVGRLTVKVFEAQGLAALDIGGKSDPFCVLELVNARLQTQTEYRTLNPIWNKIFTFAIKDFTSILELTVFDEDKNHKQEFLGRLSIPLWEISNGEKKWHLLKDRKLLRLAAGNNPKILLEMSVQWNPIRAAIRVLDPPESKLLIANQGFRRETFLLNIDRLKRIGVGIYEVIQYLESCIEWQYPARSIIALVTYQIICYTFQPYMLPLFVILFMLRQWFLRSVLGRPSHDEDIVSVDENILDDDDDEKDEDEVKKLSLRQKLQAVQEATQTLQNVLGDIASVFESARNTFRMKIQFITWLIAVALILATVILYFVPVRYLAMAYGFHKFFKPILRPNAIPTNELYNIVLRVPDSLQLIYYRPLNPITTSPNRAPKLGASGGERSKSPQSGSGPYPGGGGGGSSRTGGGGSGEGGSIGGKEPKKKFKFW